jgi:hypothetical protein
MFGGLRPSRYVNKRGVERSEIDPDSGGQQPRNPVTAIALQHPKLFHFLTAIDEDLAARRRSLGCSFCGGVLHSAAYPRKPRGAPWAPPGVPTIRHSFCCQSCRSRNMPASVRFLGRRVYPGFIVILLSMMQRGVTDRGIDELRITLGLARRTLQRWRHWWRQIFVQTPLWQYERGNFMPTIDESALPMSLLERFVNGDALARVVLLLRFLIPLSAPGPITQRYGR